MKNWEKDIEERPWWQYIKKAGWTDSLKHYIRSLLTTATSEERDKAVKIIDAYFSRLEEDHLAGKWVIHSKDVDKAWKEAKQKILNSNNQKNE